jgi:hypothetical protein
MNNQELETKLRELCSISNFIDMMEQAFAFEKDYKQTDFFKKTKINLFELIKQAKQWYTFDWDALLQRVQEGINKLDMSNISKIIDDFGSLFAQENAEILTMSENFAELFKQ